MNNIIGSIIKIIENFITDYKIKHPEYEKPVYICTNPDTRNRYKNEKYRIPENKPQCPVYNDNRCCGGCKLASRCEHCVNCGCFGFTYGQMGGNDKNYYLHKASVYYELGRLDKDGRFDWDYYYIQKKKKDIQVNKFIVVDNTIYEIKSIPDKNGKFNVISVSGNIQNELNIFELDKYVNIYNSKESAQLSNPEIR